MKSWEWDRTEQEHVSQSTNTSEDRDGSFLDAWQQQHIREPQQPEKEHSDCHNELALIIVAV